MYYPQASSCVYRGKEGMVIKGKRICAIADTIEDCEKLRENGLCKRGFNRQP